ncbi:MAG: TonB-dependent receptor, partial [Sphingomonas taxi]
CLALFQANPTYGTGGPGGAATGASAEARLAAFQNSGENFTTTLVTTGGNPNLRNEIAKTWTYGIVAQPRFIPGLTITADRIQIDLTDGLSPFTTQNFAETCFDDPNPPAGVCSAFTRLAVATSASQAGSYATGTTTTFNAGVIRFRGETYNLNYLLPLGGNAGRLEFELAGDAHVAAGKFGDGDGVRPVRRHRGQPDHLDPAARMGGAARPAVRQRAVPRELSGLLPQPRDRTARCDDREQSEPAHRQQPDAQRVVPVRRATHVVPLRRQQPDPTSSRPIRRCNMATSSVASSSPARG